MRSLRAWVAVGLIAAVVTGGGLLVGVPASGPDAGSGTDSAWAAPDTRASHVVIVGAAGLRWDDVNPRDTPQLWRLAGGGASGSLVVRSAQSYTCPADGWLTVGAGNRVRLRGAGSGTNCGRPLPAVEPGAGGGAVVAEHREVLEDNENLTYRARPGVLAELVECTVAVGQGAAVAAARPGVGRVDRYYQRLPEDASAVLERCPLSIVDAGAVAGADRRTDAMRVDALLERVLRARPARSLVMVAGVADTGGAARLHVAVADGPGVPAGTLGSWRAGYARLIDIAPTAASALGLSRSRWFAGAPLSTQADPDVAIGTRVARMRDDGRAATAQPGLAHRFAVVLVVVQLLLFAAVVPVLWRIRRAAATEEGSRPVWTAAERVLEICAVAASLVIPSALLADLVPWWRTEAPGLLLTVLTVAFVALLTALIRLAPWWRTPLWPVGSVAGVTVAVVAGDLLSGSHLQLDSVAGYGAVDGGRIAGLSAIGAGAFAVAVLLLGGYVAQLLPRTRGPLAVALTGGAGVLLAGVVGMDPGSAIALTAGVCLTAVTCSGSWLTATRLLWATFVGLAVAGVFVLLNIYPSPEHRGRLGRFFTDLGEGVPGALIHRTAEANAITFGSSPFTVLVIAGALFGGLVLLRPSGGLLRVYGLYPAIRAALIGSGVAAVLGGLVDGAGVVVVGAATAIAVPLAVVLCLRALARAHLRTAPELPPEATDGEPGPDPDDSGPDDNGPDGSEPGPESDSGAENGTDRTVAV